MKYDSGMKAYYNDIAAAIRSMLGKKGFEEIRELAGDSSPVPLREYLKEQHGKVHHSGSCPDMPFMFACTPQNFMLEYDHAINNTAAKELTLTWSQVSNFIRSHVQEIFGGVKLGEWVKPDKLGRELFFDDMYRMKDQLIITELSTESMLGLKVQRVGSAGSSDGERYVMLDDGKATLGRRNEDDFNNPDSHCGRAWAVKIGNEKSYYDILKTHLQNVDFDVLRGDYCPADFFYTAPCSVSCNGECELCWNMLCENAEEFHTDDVEVPEEWKAPKQDDEEPEQTDEEFEKEKAELEKALSEVNENKIDCPHYRKKDTLKNMGFGAVRFECKHHNESFVNGRKLTQFLATHCYNSVWCPYCHENKSENDAEQFGGYTEPTDIIPVTTEDNSPAFDYSELDNDTAASLKACETVIRTETAGYFTMLGAKFKEAQELLANHSTGTFEKWYTAMGFKRQTVYNLIRRFEFSSSPTIGGREDTFEALPLTLSYEISKPDAPPELVEKVLDGDIKDNAEYKKLKAELERTREELRQADANSAAKDKEYERELAEAIKRAEDAEFHKQRCQEGFDRVANASKANREKYDAERHKNQDLEKRIRELESKPVDVAVADNSEELSKKDEEIAELREELERLSDKSVKSFVFRMTIEEYERLIGIVKASEDYTLLSIVKNARFIKL